MSMPISRECTQAFISDSRKSNGLVVHNISVFTSNEENPPRNSDAYSICFPCWRVNMNSRHIVGHTDCGSEATSECGIYPEDWKPRNIFCGNLQYRRDVCGKRD
jgi:hypothetical protein